MNLAAFSKKAVQQYRPLQKFFLWLKKNKPKDLDEVALHYHEQAFQEIDCLDCANCCKTTGPLFTSKDVERLAKKLKISVSDFTQKYLRIDEDGDWVLQQTPCPFLLSDNFCMVYEQRPKACREYPHTDRKKLYQIGDINLANSQMCPAALQVFLRLKEHYRPSENA